MSRRNLVLVEQFFGLCERASLERVNFDLLTENVTYDLLIAQATTLSQTFRGRAAVQTYLSLISGSYDILEAERKRLFAAGEKVIALGSELAWLVRLDQVVHAEWNAVFEIEKGQISKVAMSVYRWSVLSTGSRLRPAPLQLGPPN